MSNPSADPPLREDGKLNVGAAVGRGVLAVVRSHPKNEHPYQGMIPIATGEVAEDLARYLADSEQTNSALALGVSINRDTSIRSAGGFLILWIICLVSTGNALSDCMCHSRLCMQHQSCSYQQYTLCLVGCPQLTCHQSDALSAKHLRTKESKSRQGHIRTADHTV